MVGIWQTPNELKQELYYEDIPSAMNRASSYHMHLPSLMKTSIEGYRTASKSSCGGFVENGRDSLTTA